MLSNNNPKKQLLQSRISDRVKRGKLIGIMNEKITEFIREGEQMRKQQDGKKPGKRDAELTDFKVCCN